MEELENKNLTMDTPIDNPINPNEPEANPENSTSEQGNSDFSELFSENIAENTPIQDGPAYNDSIDLQQTQAEPFQASQETDQQAEFQSPESDFQKELTNTSLDNSQITQNSQQPLEQEVTLDQQNLSESKEYEPKNNKFGFTSGILSGILLTVLVLIVTSVFAKDPIINAINYLNSLISTDSVDNQIIENTEISENNLPDIEGQEILEEENNENVDTIQQYYDRVDEIVSSEDDQETKAELLNGILKEVMQEAEEPNEELTQYISQAIMDLTINSEEEQVEEIIEDQEIIENQENPEEISNSETNNETSEEVIEEVLENTESVENNKGYTITHVNSEEEANWVLPSHCSDLTCYGEDEEFVACTSFKMVETLDENTARVSSRGGCRYKDISELVYVDFSNDSNEHNSADIPTDSDKTIESEPILEVVESIDS